MRPPYADSSIGKRVPFAVPPGPVLAGGVPGVTILPITNILLKCGSPREPNTEPRPHQSRALAN